MSIQESIKARAVIWGVRPVKPIVNLPTNALKMRLRMRNTDCVRMFIKFSDRIEHWIVCPSNNDLKADTWIIDLKQGENRTMLNSSADATNSERKEGKN